MSGPVILIGAGASWAAPAGRPLFGQIRTALTDHLQLPVEDEQWWYLAPEALLSRLQRRGVDIDGELRRMLAGGEPNALHYACAELLACGGTVWTPNFDELIEAAAAKEGIAHHVLLPVDDPRCDCPLGHLFKVHGTLGGERVIARSEDVLAPLPEEWRERLFAAAAGAQVAIVGYAGADVDLRDAIRRALSGCGDAVWFGHEKFDAEALPRRFAAPIANGRLTIALSDRPDVAFLDWAAAQGLTGRTPDDVTAAARDPLPPTFVPAPRFVPSALLRARVLDDFDGRRAHDYYRYAIRHREGRRMALNAYLTSGLIHGAPWRPAALTALDVACRLPFRWVWPYRYRFFHATFNTPPAQRWKMAQRALVVTGEDPRLLMPAASAAKEVDPRSAVALARRAQSLAEEERKAADAAWATFTLSFALRWLGDLDAAEHEAARLADGLDSLAKPVWIAWGHFELGALAALRGDPDAGVREMDLAREVFTAAGNRGFVFDALCGAIAAHRLAGDVDREIALTAQARRMLDSERTSRFAHEVLMVEDGELARMQGRLDDAERIYRELARSETLAQELLGLLGWGEVQRRRGERPVAAERALARSDETSFGFGVVHAAVTLGLTEAIAEEQAERTIAGSGFDPPVRDDVDGLLRYCIGPDPEMHMICFP